MIARCWRIVSLSTGSSQPMNNLWVEGDFLVPVLKTKNAFTPISLWLLFQGISVIFPPSFTVFWPDVCDITQISKGNLTQFFSPERGEGRRKRSRISDFWQVADLLKMSLLLKILRFPTLWVISFFARAEDREVPVLIPFFFFKKKDNFSFCIESNHWHHKWRYC